MVHVRLSDVSRSMITSYPSDPTTPLRRLNDCLELSPLVSHRSLLLPRTVSFRCFRKHTDFPSPIEWTVSFHESSVDLRRYVCLCSPPPFVPFRRIVSDLGGYFPSVIPGRDCKRYFVENGGNKTFYHTFIHFITLFILSLNFLS